jgi:hypothetical protein
MKNALGKTFCRKSYEPQIAVFNPGAYVQVIGGDDDVHTRRLRMAGSGLQRLIYEGTE